MEVHTKRPGTGGPRASRGIRLLLLLVGLLASQPLSAQEGDSFTLFGRVTDGQSGAPVAFARIRIVELEEIAVADSLGNFHFLELAPGTYTFETQRIGYRDNREASTVGTGNILLVGLEPLAVELEGLEVVAPRSELDAGLDARLAALGSPGSVRREEDLVASASPNLRDLISEGSRQYFAPCINESKTCLVVRGRRREIKFYVDDLVQPEGAAVLETYDPSELFRVEVLGKIGQIRIYTRAYADWMARTGTDPRPICPACD